MKKIRINTKLTKTKTDQNFFLDWQKFTQINLCAESIITNEKYKKKIQINDKQIRKVIIEFSLLSNQISKIKTKKNILRQLYYFNQFESTECYRIKTSCKVLLNFD